MTEADRTPLWTRAYLLLCSAVFIASAHFALLFVAIPLYVTEIGGSASLAGLVLLTFSVPSFTLRPLIGYWADTWNALGVLIAGALLIGLSGLAYLIPAILVLFIASAVRGLGWAGLMTGGYTVLAYTIPQTRRGEASGYYTSITGSASILFPALALWLLDASSHGFSIIFLLAGAFGLVSAGIGLFGLRPLVRITPVSTAQEGAGKQSMWAALLDRSVLLATAVNFSMMLAQPGISAFLPLYAREQGIGNIAYFYVVSGVIGLAIRPLLGRTVDRVGRGYTIGAGLLAQIAGVVLIMTAGSLPMILVGGVLNAAGMAVGSASAMALAMDLADPQRRGTSMATFSLSFQMGVGIGSALTGVLLDLSGFRSMYVASIVVLALGLLLILLNWSRLSRVIEPVPAPA